MKAFFFDTYALHEVVVGSVAYARVIDGARMVTTRLNLMELHYILLRQGADADAVYDALLPSCIDVDDAVVKQANALRLSLKRRNVSYVDCMGYVMAQRLGIPFLTGDKEFKNVTGVHWVA